MVIYSKKIKKFDICRHNTSGKLFFVNYVRAKDGFEERAINKPSESNYWLWGLFDDPVGGVFGGMVMKIVAKRFSFKWFRLSPKLLRRWSGNYLLLIKRQRAIRRVLKK